jgi:uncharacterized LabA/DUF88 family protein
MTAVAILIDGGNLRALARTAGHKYDPAYIEKVAHACAVDGEAILCILYYDCAPYIGTARLPISGELREFKGSDGWLRELARKDLFAVRRGTLKFRGFKPRRTPIPPKELTDADFAPDFEQKGVDMRIGLDIALMSDKKVVDKIILISGDTDCVPAMKYGRKAGIQIVVVRFPNSTIAPELLEHADFARDVAWPSP